MRPLFLAGPTDGRLDFYEECSRDLIVLQEDLIFRDSRGLVWIAPKGLEYDGASIPRIFWALVGHPLQSRHVPAGGLHDQAYRTATRLTIDPAFSGWLDRLTPEEICVLPRIEVPITRAEADYYAFYEPLCVTGNTWAHARVAYRGVRLGAWWAWRGHAKRRERERVPFSRL